MQQPISKTLLPLSFTAEEKEVFQTVAEAAKSLQCNAFLIGGYVRDKVLQRATTDADIVTDGDGIALAKAVAEKLHPKLQVHVYKNYGTAHFVFKGLDIEFVGARKESYTPESRNPTVSPGTLEDDQLRRDFSINALAIALDGSDSYSEVIDPFHGLQDLSDKIIRTPQDPDITFSDDPLRMMRAIRFATQLNFSMHPETLQGITRNAERIKIISQERITTELNKIICSAVPSLGFDLLFKTNLLKHFFPQLAHLAGVEMLEGKGHKDNFYHTLQVLDNVAHRSDSLWLRWAAILHDIAKPATKKFEAGTGWTFHGHDAVGARMTKKIFAQLKLPLGETMRYVAKLVALHLRPISLSKENITDSAMRRLLFDAGEDLEDLMMLCESDITSKNPHKVRRYLENFHLVRERLQEVEEADKMRQWQPPVSGEEIMALYNLSPSREVGILKQKIREAILDGQIANTREAALDLLHQTAKQMNLL